MIRIHQRLKCAAFLCATLSLSLICLIFSASADEGTVMGNNVRMRSDATTESTIVATLRDGDTLEILDSGNSDWLYVSHTDAEGLSTLGYISRQLVHLGPDGDAQVNSAGVTQTATVNDGGVLLCSEPDSESTVYAALEAGKLVTLLSSETDGWLLVSYRDGNGSCAGYVNAEGITRNAMAHALIIEDCTLLHHEPITDTTVFSDAEPLARMSAMPVAPSISGLSLTQPHTVPGQDLGTELTSGTEVEVLDIMGNWFYVRANGTEGYIKAESVSAAFDAGLYHGIVTGDSVRLRKEATADSSTLSTISGGVNLRLTDHVNGWYAVSYNGKDGYVSADYVDAAAPAGAYIQTTEDTALMAGLGEDYAVLSEIGQGMVLTVIGVYGDWYLVSWDNMNGFVNSASVCSTTRNGFYDGTNGSGIGAQIAAYACQFNGNPYQWGGTSLTNGADCSGFVMKVYQHFGVSLPHSSAAMRSVGYGVSYSEMQPGDIVCYQGHVGIYAGNGKIINALGEKWGITYTNVNYKSILAIRRIF